MSLGMSSYETDLFPVPPSDEEEQPQPAVEQPQPDAGPSPSDALAAVANVITNPLGTAAEILPTDPKQSSPISFGWAVVGACAIAVLWAASIDAKWGKKG